MKIIYCIPDTFRPGGIERMLSIKSSYLAEYDGGNAFDVYIITTGQKGEHSYYTFSPKIHFIDLAINYDEALALPFLKRYFLRRKKRNLHEKKLTDLLHHLSADLVISTFTHDSAFLPSIKDGSKKILEFHFSKGYKTKQALKKNESFLVKIAYYYLQFVEEHITAPKYDAFVVLTERDKEQWRTIVPHVQAIPNILSIHAQQEAPLKNKIALSVGRLTSQKGYDKLIRLWVRIKQACPEWKLYIVGSGEEEETLKALIKAGNLEEHVYIFPPDKAILSRYLNSSVYVMTSRFEGFPMVLLEAMGCGLPCVSYDYPNGPSEIIRDGVDGFLINNNDQDLFVEKTVELMQNRELRIEMGMHAYQHIKRYSCDAVMEKWISLFHHVKNTTK